MPTSNTTRPTGAGQTVLAVDDDPAVVNVCRAFLEQAGFTVLGATGSSEALKVCKNHPGPIHVLVTDLVMPPPEFSLASAGNEFPHVHGHELAVRALRMRNDLRIVLMSGNQDQDLAGYGIKRGALPFLAKPFEGEQLVRLITQALQAPPPTVESLRKESSTGFKGDDEWFD